MTPAAELIRRTGIPLLLVSLAGGAVASFSAARQSPIVEVVQSFVVPLAEVRGAAQSNQGNPVEATDLFVGTLSGWLASPDFVARVYERARVGSAPRTVRGLSRAFAAQRRGGQVVDVRFHVASSADAQALAQAVREEVTGRAGALSEGAAAPTFRIIAQEALVVPVRPWPLLRGLVAIIVLFFLGLNLVLLADFLRTPPADPRPPGIP